MNDERRTQLVIVAAVIGVVLISSTLAPMLLYPSTSTSGNATPTATPIEGETYDYSESSGSDRPDEIGDLHRVPDTYTKLSTNSVPAPDVKASAGSQTMQVTVRKEDGEPVIDLTDDRTHKGRWVSLDTKWFKQTLGGVPEVAYIKHESGDEYASPITVRGGQAVFYVQGFSTNTVTFDGEFNITATPAADGDQFVYNASDGGENLAINVTGTVNREWDNVTATGVNASSSRSISVAGNMEPVGPTGSDPVLTITAGDLGTNSYNPVSAEGDGTTDQIREFIGDTGGDATQATEVKLNPDYTGKFENITVIKESTIGSDYGFTVDIYLVQENPDGVFGEGKKIGNWDPAFSSGSETIELSDEYNVSKGTNYTVEFVTTSTDNDGTKDTIYFGHDDSGPSGWIVTKEGPDPDGYGSIKISEKTQLNNLNVTDGNGEKFTFGDFSSGQEKSKQVNVSTASTELNWSGDGDGVFDWTLELQERTQTVDPVVELNSENDSYSGTLSDGETVSLSIPDSAIANGTNTVNITVGDGTLSSDAPTPQVNMNYSHDIPKQKSVDYQAEAWSERYTVARTWEEDTANATLKIPWASDHVVALRNVSVKYEDDTGTLVNTDDNPNYYFTDSGAVVIELGDVNAGWTTTVDADGSKVQVTNGTITVLQPTDQGSTLDTKIRIESKSSGFHIAVGGTVEGSQVHYPHNETWSGEDAYAKFEPGKQKVHLPNAGAGSETRLRTLPLEVSPDSGEVLIEVPDDRVNKTEPVYRVRPGSTTGDSYSVTFVNAKDSTDYILYDETNGIVIDFGTASSPLTLSADDDEKAIIQFELDDDSSGGGGDDGGGGGGGEGEGRVSIMDANRDDGSGFLPLIALALGIAGLAIAARRDGAIVSAGQTIGQTAESTTSRVPDLGDRTGGWKGKVGAVLTRVLKRAGHWANVAVVRAARGIELIFSNGIIAASVAGALIIGAVQAGLITVPPGAQVIVIVAGVGLGSIPILRQIDAFSKPIWASLNVSATLLALEAISEQDIVTAVIESRVWPVLAIFGAYLVWEAFELIRQSVDRGGGDGDGTEEVTINIEDETGGN